MIRVEIWVDRKTFSRLRTCRAPVFITAVLVALNYCSQTPTLRHFFGFYSPNTFFLSPNLPAVIPHRREAAVEHQCCATPTAGEVGVLQKAGRAGQKRCIGQLKIYILTEPPQQINYYLHLLPFFSQGKDCKETSCCIVIFWFYKSCIRFAGFIIRNWLINRLGKLLWETNFPFITHLISSLISSHLISRENKRSPLVSNGKCMTF